MGTLFDKEKYIKHQNLSTTIFLFTIFYIFDILSLEFSNLNVLISLIHKIGDIPY